MDLREPCSGACEHGDPEMDDTNNPFSYAGEECFCRPCANFFVCKVWSPKNVCTSCALQFGRTPLSPVGVGECCVCREHVGGVVHPAGCRHVICAECLWHTACIRNDLPAAKDYGLNRSCGCDDQPAVWGTAECSECVGTVEAFERTEAGEAWTDACAESDDNVACPVCRRRAGSSTAAFPADDY